MRSDGDVAVAGNEPLRGRDRADLEVAHLHEPDEIDALADRRRQAALGPARVQLHAHARVEAAREVDRVAQRVHEPDVDPQRVGVLDREVDAAGRASCNTGASACSNASAASSHVSGANGPGREDDGACADGDRGVDRANEAITLRVPPGGVRELERSETDEVDDPQTAATASTTSAVPASHP